jgi:peroxiredoxin
MRTILSAIAFFFSWILPSTAQNVIIQGMADAYRGEQIGLYTYNDLLSYRELFQDSTTVGWDGRFTLEMSTGKVQRAFIRCGKIKAHLYVTPGGSYEVSMGLPDPEEYVNPELERIVNLGWQFKDTTDLNALIIHYNMMFENYYIENYQYFITSKGYAVVDSFRVIAKERYKDIRNKYFQDYIDYNIALMLANMTRFEKPVYNEYLARRPVQHDNYEYMELFHNAFKKYLSQKANVKGGESIYPSVNDNPSLSSLMQALAEDKLLKNDTLRELVLLKGLKDLYHEPGFKKENVLNLIDQLQDQTRIAQHKLMAGNVLRGYTTLTAGSKAPLFELPDKDGKMVGLSDLKGKYVYIIFYKADCADCMPEIKAITDLKKEFGDKIVFISISLDKSIETMRSFQLKNPKYNWIFLHAGEDTRIKEDYNIKTTPAFFFINPFGKLVQYPAQSPSQGVESTMKALLKKKK